MWTGLKVALWTTNDELYVDVFVAGDAEHVQRERGDFTADLHEQWARPNRGATRRIVRRQPESVAAVRGRALPQEPVDLLNPSQNCAMNLF